MIPSARPYDFLLFGLGPYATLDALTETGVFPREGVGFQTLTSTRFTTR